MIQCMQRDEIMQKNDCERGKNLLNVRFGRLVVIKQVGLNKNRQKLWLCKCDCGNEKVFPTSYLTSGDTKSCGCYRKETEIKNLSRFWKRTSIKKQYPRLYRIWIGIKTRCNNKNSVNYKDYGQRGIKICDEWENNFINFKDWALSNEYKENLSIDRIDVNGDYEPNNCRWATIEEQNNNKRNSIKVTLKGETNTIKYFADKYNISKSIVRDRIKSNYDDDIVLKKGSIVSRDGKGRFKRV